MFFHHISLIYLSMCGGSSVCRLFIDLGVKVKGELNAAEITDFLATISNGKYIYDSYVL